MLQQLDAATNAVASVLTAQTDELAKLRAQVATGTATPEAVDAIGVALQGEISKLTAMGSNPDNPIPVP